MKEYLQNFSKELSIGFIMLAIIFALTIRVILCIFKAYAHYKGETGIKKENRKSKWKYFLQSFFSNSDDYRIDDHWLPFIIGVFELIFISLLFKYLLINVLGAWLALKAIGTWSTKNTRSAYNRFLLGNILSLFFSYLLFKIFFCFG